MSEAHGGGGGGGEVHIQLPVSVRGLEWLREGSSKVVTWFLYVQQYRERFKGLKCEKELQHYM